MGQGGEVGRQGGEVRACEGKGGRAALVVTVAWSNPVVLILSFWARR